MAEKQSSPFLFLQTGSCSGSLDHGLRFSNMRLGNTGHLVAQQISGPCRHGRHPWDLKTTTHSVSFRSFFSLAIKSKTGQETKHSYFTCHSFPFLLHLMHKIFVVKHELYKNMQQKELGNSVIQKPAKWGVSFLFFSSNVKQFQEKWSHSPGCLFSVLRKEPISTEKQHGPGTVWRGGLDDKPTLVWHQHTDTPTQDAFPFDEVKEETLAETVRDTIFRETTGAQLTCWSGREPQGATGSLWDCGENRAPSFSHLPHCCVPSLLRQPYQPN